MELADLNLSVDKLNSKHNSEIITLRGCIYGQTIGEIDIYDLEVEFE